MNFRILYILLFLSCTCYAQNGALDSLAGNAFKTERIENNLLQADSLEVDRLHQLAASFLYKNMDSLNFYAKKGMELAEAIDYKTGEIDARYYQSLYLSESGRTEEAIVLMQEAEAIASDNENELLLQEYYYHQGNLHAYAGDISTSTDYFSKVIDIVEKDAPEDKDGFLIIKNGESKKILSLAYEGLAANYFTLNYFEKALKYINKADRLNQELGDELNTAKTLSNKAEIHLKIEEYEDAQVHINEAIEIFVNNEEKDWLAFAERVRGDIFLKQGLYKMALNSYTTALRLQDEIEDAREKAFLDKSVAQAHLGEENYELAKEFAQAALDQGKNLNEHTVNIESAETLSKVYEAQGDDKTALYYQKQFKKYTDKLFNEKNMRSIAGLEFKQQSQKAEKDKAEAEDEKRWYFLVSTGVVLILLSVLFMTQRSRKLERKLNDLLTKKNRVLGRRELQLKWMNETKNKLFSIISHDLRSPIASLNSLIDLLNDKQIEPEEFIEYAPQLSDQVKNVSFTLNNLLHWSKQQMKGARNNPQKHNLHDLADQSIDLLMHQAKQKNLFVRNEIPEDAEIYADGDQITIIFRNLISNAIKFTENDGAIIIKGVEQEGSWEVEVKDTGVGMDQRIVDQLLSKSSYMESTYGTNNEKGTGIGLSLCKEMITKSGGEFHVKSAIGLGSSFFFTLEKYEEEVQEIPEPSMI